MLNRLALFLLVPLALAPRLGAQPRPSRVVLGYSAAWRDAICPPEEYNYAALTHLARAFLVPHSDGSIGVPADYFNKTMESLAREHGVKLLVSLGGEAENADNWLSIARNPKYLQRFYTELEPLVVQHGYDGIDIDWEPSPLTDDDGVAYTSLLKGLRARFPKMVLTTALGASEYWISHHSWKDVFDSVNYVNVMVYTYSGAWGRRAAYASNLHPPGAYPPQPEFSVEEGMRNLIENHKAPPAKLLIGITFWASRFAVNKIGDPFPINQPGYSDDITYEQTMGLIHSGQYHEFWDEKAGMPYLERNAGGSVVCFENPQSIRLKCEYANKLNCAGIMIWHVGADLYGQHAPLMDSVAESVGAAPQRLSRGVLEAQILDLQKSANVQSDAAELSELSDDETENLRLQLEKKAALMQDQLWQTEEQERGKK
jgi:chitinase